MNAGKSTLREIIEDPRRCLDRALNTLKIVVDAQPKVADTTFFEALINYRDIRSVVVENNLLPQNELEECDRVYLMYVN